MGSAPAAVVEELADPSLTMGGPPHSRPRSQTLSKPNLLLIMTDEERYPPAYEDDRVRRFRKEQLGARESIRGGARVP